jgi:hypothetical protein
MQLSRVDAVATVIQPGSRNPPASDRAVNCRLAKARRLGRGSKCVRHVTAPRYVGTVS